MSSVLHEPFIPIQAGQFAFIKEQPILSDILDQIGYEVSGTDIIFTKDLTALTPAAEDVLIKLVVLDIDKHTDYSLLPIPADMAWQVVTEVFKMFSNEPIPQKIAESGVENK